MPLFKTTNLDRLQLKLAFALLLRDPFTRSPTLLGKIKVSFAGQPEVAPFVPFQKPSEATFLFFDLPAGDYTLRVASDEQTPYYVDADIPDDGAQITLPIP